MATIFVLIVLRRNYSVLDGRYYSFCCWEEFIHNQPRIRSWFVDLFQLLLMEVHACFDNLFDSFDVAIQLKDRRSIFATAGSGKNIVFAYWWRPFFLLYVAGWLAEWNLNFGKRMRCLVNAISWPRRRCMDRHLSILNSIPLVQFFNISETASNRLWRGVGNAFVHLSPFFQMKAIVGWLNALLRSFLARQNYRGLIYTFKSS